MIYCLITQHWQLLEGNNVKGHRLTCTVLPSTFYAVKTFVKCVNPLELVNVRTLGLLYHSLCSSWEKYQLHPHVAKLKPCNSLGDR